MMQREVKEEFEFEFEYIVRISDNTYVRVMDVTQVTFSI